MRRRKTKDNKPIIKKIVAIVLLAIAIFLLMLLAGHPVVVECYYANGFYIAVCRVLHPVLNIFPFSVGDVLYIAVVVYLVYAFVRLIVLLFKKRFNVAGRFFLGLIIGLQSAIVAFYLFWGMNYFRQPASVRLNLRDTSFTTADLKAVTCLLIDSVNATRARINPADLAQSNTHIYNTARYAIRSLSKDSLNFRAYDPDIKPSILTPLLNYIGTSGYYNPFTSEAQVNYQMPVFNRPFVVCHEMSHQMGYGAEDEADYAGFVIATHSPDRLLRYSAYHLAVQEFMYSLGGRDTLAHRELKALLSKDVRNDYITERNYWRAYQNKLNAISSVFYDNFLKANNQPQGLETYNRMVLLVMASYRSQWVH
jgi:IS1 family transposase